MKADNSGHLIEGFSAKIRAREKTGQILRFLRSETWSTVDVITQLLGVKSPQVAQRALTGLETEGLVVRHSVPVGSGRAFIIWGITAEGVAASYEQGEEIPLKIPRYFEPSKVALVMMRHRLDIQRIKIKAEGVGWKRWRREEIFPREEGRKNPDALADTRFGVVAIEIERTVKWPKRYNKILESHVIAIHHNRYTDVYYFSPTQAMRDRLKAIFADIKTITFQGRKVDIKPAHLERLHFLTYDEPFS